MKTSYLVTATLLAICIAGCASSSRQIDTRGLTLVAENHATLERNGKRYTLDSYIVPFRKPYYITVQGQGVVSLEEAVGVAEEYIQPRGCTEPLVRRADLDRSNVDNSQWLIGVEC